MATPLVGLIMGSRSDWETMRHAAETLDELGKVACQRLTGLGLQCNRVTLAERQHAKSVPLGFINPLAARRNAFNRPRFHRRIRWGDREREGRKSRGCARHR